jgi:hypothetical protein
MSEKNLKVDNPVTIAYQAANKETGAVVISEIYLPTGLKDLVGFPDVTLVERDASGSYAGSFTPDDVGDWVVLTHKADGSGQIMKRYSVGSHNLQSVGDDVNTIQGVATTIESKVDLLDSKIGVLDTPPMCS